MAMESVKEKSKEKDVKKDGGMAAHEKMHKMHKEMHHHHMKEAKHHEKKMKEHSKKK